MVFVRDAYNRLLRGQGSLEFLPVTLLRICRPLRFLFVLKVSKKPDFLFCKESAVIHHKFFHDPMSQMEKLALKVPWAFTKNGPAAEFFIFKHLEE